MMNVRRIGKIALLGLAVIALVPGFSALPDRSLHAAQPPMPIRDVDNPARNVFQWVLGCQIQSGDPECTDQQNGVVPSGKIFVIETVSARVAVPAGQRVELSMEAGNSFEIPLSFQGTIGFFEYLSALTPVRMYVASFNPLIITAFRGVNNGTVNVQVNLTGYMLTQ